ncbi:MAG TPA: enolase C-terminal domain-like protein [Mycobacteriales bacterium]|nr:enolase C-terminal domain-like protein [Mycobacteriales bacterium]
MSVAIDALRASAYEIPTEEPESDGTLAWRSTVLVLVEATAGDATGTGYTYAHQAAVPFIEAKLAPIVCGHDAFAVRAATDKMIREVRNVGATGLVSMAISAVDIALWDLKARLLDLPLATLLDASHDAVPIYGSGGFTSYDNTTLARQLEGWVAAGIPRVKIKTGREPAADRARLSAAREAIGDDTTLYVDANGAYAPRQAIEWAHVYRHEYDVRWFEEPVSSDDVAGLRLVRESAPGGIDIAAGEYGWNPWYYEPMLEADAVDCMQVDVTRCLGITGFLRAADMSDGHQLDLSAHCAPNLSAHVCTAVRRLRHLEYFHDHVRIEHLLFDGVLEPQAGGVLRPDLSRPGHGLQFKHQDARQYQVA